MRNIVLCLAVTLFCVRATIARAAENDFGVGIGYARIDFDSGNPFLDGRDAIHFDPFISYAPFRDLPQLRIGASGGVSASVDDTRGAFISNGGEAIFIGGGDVSLVLFEPELRVSWRQQFGPDDLYYLEAGVAGGGVFAWIDAEAGDIPDDTDLEDNDGSWSARAFVRLGIPVTGGIAGVEASYLRGGNMRFADDLEGEPEVFYVGIFGSLTF